jgi:hypothetical protein
MAFYLSVDTDGQATITATDPPEGEVIVAWSELHDFSIDATLEREDLYIEDPIQVGVTDDFSDPTFIAGAEISWSPLSPWADYLTFTLGPPDPEPELSGALSTGGYVRHRDRMVAQSIIEDLQNTLIACRWMAGTTTREVVDPYDRAGGWQIVTVVEADTLKLLGKNEDGTPAMVSVIDYFPETGGNNDENGESRKTPLNTLAVDHGVTGDVVPVELGSNLVEQPYTFSLAFYAESDAVALAVMNDLRDRYLGRLVKDDNIDLFDYNQADFDDTSTPVHRMEVDGFTYEQDANDTATPADVHLYYARLEVVDFVDDVGAASILV